IQNLNPPTNNIQTLELFLDNNLLEDNNTFLEEESNNELISSPNLYNQRFSTRAFNIDNYTKPNACYN
ncbi:15834_t:CDS:1, partial [Dentiscutata heterogama]